MKWSAIRLVDCNDHRWLQLTGDVSFFFSLNKYKPNLGLRDTEWQRDRETERQRDRETERQRDREAKRQRHRETERQRDKETKRQRDRETNQICVCFNFGKLKSD